MEFAEGRTRLRADHGVAGGRLKIAAAGRPRSAPLLLCRGDHGFGDDPSVNYRTDMRAIVAEVGLDPAIVTAHAFRHSSIVRQLLPDGPVRVGRQRCATTVTDRARIIRNSSPSTRTPLSRRALLQLDASPSGNVLALRR